MSQENVEVFKRAFEAINRRDGEALLAELDPEVEWHGAILMAMGGKETTYHVRARGTASEAEIQTPHATVVEFKNGKGFRIRTYLDPDAALDAVGLSE